MTGRHGQRKGRPATHRSAQAIPAKCTCHPEGGVSGSPAEMFPALPGMWLTSRHHPEPEAFIWVHRKCLRASGCEETEEAQPGACSHGAPRAPIPLLPPTSSPKRPGPESQAKQPLPAHPQPGSHRHTQACVHSGTRVHARSTRQG